MTSLVAKFYAAFSGRAVGTTINSNAQSPMASNIGISLSSANASGASFANEATSPTTRSITAGGTDTIDLSSYTNALNETTKSVSKVRLIQIEHSSTSLASAIVVGNAANPFPGLLTSGASTFTLKPGEGVIMYSPTTAAMTRDGTHKNILATNSDGTNAATWKCYVVGEV